MTVPGALEASYLLRFDDVCPTMNWAVWDRLEPFLLENGIRPILAVVPDNQDPKLRVAPALGAFWDRMRTVQASGWTMALHGYTHVYSTTCAGIVGLNARSEFAGVPEEVQRASLEAGVGILRREGIDASTWVAPAHSFDEATLRGLKAIGIEIVSDGYSMYPYRDAHGMLWLPQQLWTFAPRRRGVWTVCLHINKWNEADAETFVRQTREYLPRITDVPSVAAAYGGRRRSTGDVLWAVRHLAGLRTRRWLSGLIRGRLRGRGGRSAEGSGLLV